MRKKQDVNQRKSCKRLETIQLLITHALCAEERICFTPRLQLRFESIGSTRINGGRTFGTIIKRY